MASFFLLKIARTYFRSRLIFFCVSFLLSLSGCQCEKESDTPLAQRIARKAPQWLLESTVARIELSKERGQNIFERVGKKLPELQRVGFTALWLSTVIPTSTLYREYGPTEPVPAQDFLNVDAGLGTLDEFKKLVNDAHASGLKVIIDLPTKYTAWDSELVKEHPDWFHTNEEGAIVAPNTEWSDVADLNYEHHELRKYMFGVLRFWVGDVGVDGLAFHKAHLIPLDFWVRARSEVVSDTQTVFLAQSNVPAHFLEAFDAAYSNDGGIPETERGGIPLSLAPAIESELSMFPKGSLRMRVSRVISDNPHVMSTSAQHTYLENIFTVMAYTLPGIPVTVFDANWLNSANSKPSPLAIRLNEFRKEFPAAASGGLTARQLSEQASLIAYERKFENTRLLILLNYASDEQQIRLQLPENFSGSFNDYLSGTSLTQNAGGLEFTVKPMDAKILIRTSEGNK
ncbi:MAG: alpha-glucosidase C-terminal domain-containing protein [Ignavibacteriae bacterium]|nr:alpha-glucosidase C-terminal domain-containing protein [Ignavibacteriota bacterium]